MASKGNPQTKSDVKKLPVESLTIDPDGDLVLIFTDDSQNKCWWTLEKTEFGLINQSHFEKIFSVSAKNKAKSRDARAREVRILVSSKCMSMASPVFKAMLNRDNFREGHDLSKGKAEVPLPEDNFPAFKILLDIIHYRGREVPKAVDIDIITHIAILADKYQLIQPVQPFADLWLVELRKSLPTFFTPNVVLWLSISWVFKFPIEFKQMTQIMQKGRDGCLGSHDPGDTLEGLPVPSRLFVILEEHREKTVSEASSVVTTLIEKYLKSVQPICSSTFSGNSHINREKQHACDCLMLGSLQNRVATQSVFGNAYFKPIDVFTRAASCSVEEILTYVRGTHPMALCDNFVPANPTAKLPSAPAPVLAPTRTSVFGAYPLPPPFSHGVKESIIEQIDAIEARIVGLNLEDFQ